MRITLLAVGGRMPDWVTAGVENYTRRLPAEFRLVIREVPLARRGKGVSIEQCRRRESEALVDRLDAGDHVVALAVEGRSLDTPGLAQRIARLRDQSRNLSLLVGGPDGLDPACLARADEHWSLSALTLPHPLVRIVVAEQLYRVWSLLQGHPYHRE